MLGKCIGFKFNKNIREMEEVIPTPPDGTFIFVPYS